VTEPSTNIDLARLFQLRLVVARYGEMDIARWWNTNGVLGRRGALVLKRGFPSTNHFAQARIAFAVARSRCRALFDPPDAITLWTLPAEVEDRFEEAWQAWLDEPDQWAPVFDRLSEVDQHNLLAVLTGLGLAEARHAEKVASLRRAAEGRAVPLPGTQRPSDDLITLLAAGFARGENGSPAIPYAKLGA
jgi:hypothetical protein